MFNLLKKILEEQRGSIERVLVTILLIIIGIGLFISLSSWITTQNSEMTDVATLKIDNAVEENSN